MNHILGRPGQPRIEELQPGLMETIFQIVEGTSSADERRRTEDLRTITSLSELLKRVEAEGFRLSRSALYLRLLPRRFDSSEGKRHTKTVPVRLMKPSNDEHKHHDDSRFCFQTIENIKQIAGILGPKQVLVISVDDKAKVPLGVTAAKLQSTMAMTLERKVRLPDHDFVVASKHKLVPSVTAILKITPDRLSSDAVTYSGKIVLKMT